MANPVLGKSLCSDWFFLGQDFAVRTVSMETVQPVYFRFGAKPANSKFATKRARKKNCEYCHSSQWNYQRNLERLKFFPNFKDGWRRQTFSKWVLLQSTLPRPRANIPQYCPCARLVSGQYCYLIHDLDHPSSMKLFKLLCIPLTRCHTEYS